MKQVVFKKGSAVVIDVAPSPLQKGTILVQLKASCISPGTEISSLSSSGKSLIEKARAHPDKLKRSLNKMKTEGIFSVVQKARQNQGRETPSGYSASGIVADVGPDVQGFRKGMRVAVAGAGHANHAEYVVVPVNLVMPIPENVSFDHASTCALGGIALQGIRRAETTIGEIVAVIGCGAIGLLTIQLLKAAGCIVVALDMDSRRLDLAKKLGADMTLNAAQENVAVLVVHYADGHGVDRVIITAATQSNTVLSQAFQMCRKKGRVVLVGVIGSEFKRSDMYAKELDFVISTSYGPGRYDEQYERFGHDYPYAYVRWTEKRNMVAYLRCIEAGSVRLEEIIEDTFPIDEAAQAYDRLKEGGLLLVTLHYPDGEAEVLGEKTPGSSTVKKSWEGLDGKVIRVGLVGAGSFMQSMHIPHLKQLAKQYQVTHVCNLSGLSARQAANHFPGCKATTQYDELLNSDVDMVLIGTRHDTHAELSIKALEAGKAVFVEKPMCISRDEYQTLCQVIEGSGAPYMVGYNRRFSPIAGKIKKLLQHRINPMIVQYTVNAGYVPYSSWVHTSEGGGRIVGEGCHIFDLFRYLVGSPVSTVSVDAINPKTGSVRPDDNVVVTVRYEDGSLANMIYTALGSKNASKETMSVFCDEQILEMDDYKVLKTYGAIDDVSLKKQDKGHFRELEAFAECIAGGRQFLIPWDELRETWEIARKVADAVRTETK